MMIASPTISGLEGVNALESNLRNSRYKLDESRAPPALMKYILGDLRHQRVFAAPCRNPTPVLILIAT
jgi:hypothetical protein